MAPFSLPQNKYSDISNRSDIIADTIYGVVYGS
jgi:hypothetical protein